MVHDFYFYFFQALFAWNTRVRVSYILPILLLTLIL